MVRNDTGPHQMVAFAMKLLAHPLRILISLRVREGPRLCSSARQKKNKKTTQTEEKSNLKVCVFGIKMRHLDTAADTLATKEHVCMIVTLA